MKYTTSLTLATSGNIPLYISADEKFSPSPFDVSCNIVNVATDLLATE